MSIQIDYNEPRYAQSAAEILRRHDSGEPEANITSAVRDFLIVTGLVRADEIVEENPPAQGSRRAVDLAALDTFIEFKRRIGTAGGFNPNAEYVQQLDDYLEQSGEQGRVRMGILTDGKRWLLRWPNAGPVRTALPYAFTLEDADHWITLFEWLRDHALSAERDKQPSRSSIAQHFGPTAPTYERDIAALKSLYEQHSDSGTISVKRQLWENLLTAALGEIARSSAPTGRPLRATHLSERRHRHGCPSLLRRRHQAAGGERPGRLATWTRLPKQDRSSRGRGVGLLRVAHRGGRAATAHDPCPSYSQVQVAEGSQRCSVHPLRDRDTSR